MYLYVFRPHLVISVAVQTLKSGHVVAYLYYDSDLRSFEDCVRYGSSRDFVSLSDCINYFVTLYGKVTFSAYCDS